MQFDIVTSSKCPQRVTEAVWRERENSLFTRVIDKHVYFFSFFYIQPSPKQGTTLDIIIHVHIF